MASRRYERVAIGGVQLRQPLAPRRTRLDLVRLSQPRQQRLSLGDLRHLGRRRKAFERGREDGVGIDEAAGRLIELCERQRRAQFEAARGLLLCDGDGGLEGFLGGRGVGGVAPQQHFAAHPMQFRFECAKAQAVARRQRFVEDRDGAVGIARPRLGLGQRDFQ